MNISENKIGGYYDDDWQLIYTPEGPKAIADALLVNRQLTKLDTRGNLISGEAAEGLAKAVLDSKSLLEFGKVPMKELRADELTTLNLNSKELGPPEAHVLASLVAITGQLTTVCSPGHEPSSDEPSTKEIGASQRKKPVSN